MTVNRCELQEADNVSKHLGYRKLIMSVNTYVTGKREADNASKHVGYWKLTVGKHGLQEADNTSKHVGYWKLTVSVNTWVI